MILSEGGKTGIETIALPIKIRFDVTGLYVSFQRSSPLGINCCVTFLYRLVSRAHLGKLTLSLPRLLCSLDVVLVVTCPPF